MTAHYFILTYQRLQEHTGWTPNEIMCRFEKASLSRIEQNFSEEEWVHDGEHIPGRETGTNERMF